MTGVQTCALPISIDGAAEETWQTFSLSNNLASLLVPGWNELAVEVHQIALPALLSPGDLSFDLEMEASLAAPLAVDALVPQGDVWSYPDTNAYGLYYPDDSWHDSVFDDSKWKRGRARLGFGIGGESTIIDGGPANGRFPSLLFRNVFDVARPSDYSALHLFLLRDDGAQVYLNGNRVLTDGVDPLADLGDFAKAETPAASQLTWRHFLLDPHKLLPGRNLIAVELHQATNNGPDTARRGEGRQMEIKTCTARAGSAAKDAARVQRSAACRGAALRHGPELRRDRAPHYRLGPSRPGRQLERFSERLNRKFLERRGAV